MDRLERRDVCEFTEARPSEKSQAFLATGRGLRIVPEPYGEVDSDVLKPDTGDFTKWLRATHPDLRVEVPAARKLVLHSNEIWLPLVLLASDVTLVMYLNVVSNYVYDRMKGAIRGHKARVHCSAEYVDAESGTVKRFDFSGDHESLVAITDKLNLDSFFSD
jgi:hypothetical protein